VASSGESIEASLSRAPDSGAGGAAGPDAEVPDAEVLDAAALGAEDPGAEGSRLAAVDAEVPGVGLALVSPRPRAA
jgi:hypothetical protein